MRLAQSLAASFSPRAALLLVVFMVAVTTQAQVAYKCVEGGQTVYKDQPCAGSQGTVADDVGRRNDAIAKKAEEAKKASYTSASELAAVEAREKQEKKVCGQFYATDPAVGMTGPMVLRCSAWARPNDVNTTTTVRGTTAQWVYKCCGYVYLNEQGIVTAVQARGR